MQFCVLAYAPDLLSNVRVNIGIILEGQGFADVRSISDWSRVQAAFPDADIRLLTLLMDEIRVKLQLESEREAMLHLMHESWSNSIVVSDWKACSGMDATAEIEALASRHL